MEGPLAIAALLLAQPQEPLPEARRVRFEVSQVLADGSEIARGLAVSVGWADGPRMETLRELALDDRGRAEVELALPEEAGAEPWLFARVDESGFQRQERWARFQAYGKPVRLALSVRRGGTLVGVARPAAESGGQRTKLRLVPADGRAVEPALATADERGRFVLHFVERGRYQLMATSPPHGVALVRDLALDPAGEPARLEVELAPGLGLAGRVVDPDGAPVRGFPLAVLPEGFTLAADEELREREWEVGTLGPRVETDAAGRFAFNGLPPGRYALAGKGLGTVRVLAPELHAAGTSDARVVVPLHRVELRVRDHEGALVPLAERVSDAYGVQPGDPRLVLRDVEQPLVPRRIDGTAAHLWTAEGHEVRFAYSSASDPLVEGRLFVPASPWLVRAELQLGPPVEPATLALRVLADGERWAGSKTVTIVSASGISLAPEFRMEGSAQELRLPPGKCSVRVQPYRSVFCASGMELDELTPALGPAWAEVELRPGETTSLELTVPPNARLAVELALPRAGRPMEIDAALATNDYREPLRAVLRGARIELLPAAGGPPVVPEFRVELAEHEIDEVQAPWVAPGRESVSISGIAPGAYTLVATLHDGRRIEHEVVLEGRRTTTVQIAPE